MGGTYSPWLGMKNYMDLVLKQSGGLPRWKWYLWLVLGHVHGYLLQEIGMGTGLIEADLHGRAKRVETSVSRGLCTLEWPVGAAGTAGREEGLIVHPTIVPWVLELFGEEETW